MAQSQQINVRMISGQNLRLDAFNYNQDSKYLNIPHGGHRNNNLFGGNSFNESDNSNPNSCSEESKNQSYSSNNLRRQQTQRKCLIANSNKSKLELLTNLFKALGFVVEQAINGHQASMIVFEELRQN